MKSIFIIVSFLFPYFLLAQNGDCFTGLSICKKDSFIFNFSQGIVKNEATTSNASCFNSFNAPTDIEFQSMWIKWRVVKSGSLTFTITPENPRDDIDFVVYKIDNDSCANKNAVRCMASGSIPTICELFGATGLREEERDTSEAPGCSATQNNFLAPLSMQAGERYVLFINNYTSAAIAKGSIRFGGTSLLGCETSSIIEAKGNNLVKIYPNPVSEMVTVEAQAPLSKILILNDLGQVLMRKELGEDFTNQVILPIKQLEKGHYFIQYEMKNGRRENLRFVKL
jgi:Secretion system C-terminal sorting domain